MVLSVNKEEGGGGGGGWGGVCSGHDLKKKKPEAKALKTK